MSTEIMNNHNNPVDVSKIPQAPPKKRPREDSAEILALFEDVATRCQSVNEPTGSDKPCRKNFKKKVIANSFKNSGSILQRFYEGNHQGLEILTTQRHRMPTGL